MNDMSQVIVPKSDQINADDFIAGPQTITIRDVQIRGGQEQPVSIFFEGSDKAYRPCKSMSRVLVAAWGPDAKVYVGRSLTLYRDPTVKWGGLEVGGIRISHMSHIDGKMQMQLTATKGQRRPHIVMPLVIDQPKPKTQTGRQTPEEWTAKHITAVDACTTMEELDAVIAKGKGAVGKLNANEATHELRDRVMQAYTDMTNALTRGGKPDDQMGEGFSTDDESEF